MDSLSMWIAALLALYVGVTRNGVNARPEETVMMVASGRLRRCSMNAPISRMGPRTFVVMISSAVATKSGAFQSSPRMTPAMVMRTLSSGCSAMTWAAAASMLAGSAVSMRTV
jgi:hypothetical protein